MTLPMEVLWAGFLIGLVFGAAGQRTGFCLTSGLRLWWLSGDGRRIRAFALALAVAVAGTQWAEASGLVTLGGSLYLQSSYSWPLMLVGGLLFGYGMVMANGCGARALVLLGSGNLRSLVVLLCLGVSAYAMLSGVLAPLRVSVAAFTTATSAVSPPTVWSWLASWNLPASRWFTVLLVAGGLVVFAFRDPMFRVSGRDIAGGLAIGLLVPAGWLATGYLGADDFDPVPVASLTFVAPIGDAIQYLMLSTGTALRFGVAVVGGVLAGALVAALATRSFELEGFSEPRRMLRYIGGGVLMGGGGALSLGCSIGQGLTGLSTLALGSFVAAAGIVAGAWLGYRGGPLRLPAL